MRSRPCGGTCGSDLPKICCWGLVWFGVERGGGKGNRGGRERKGCSVRSFVRDDKIDQIKKGK